MIDAKLRLVGADYSHTFGKNDASIDTDEKTLFGLGCTDGTTI